MPFPTMITPLTYVPLKMITEKYYLKEGKLYFRRQDEEALGWAKGFNLQWADKEVPLKFQNGYPHIRMRHPKIKRERILVRARHVAWTLIHGRKPMKGDRIQMVNGDKTDFREENMRITCVAL